MTVPPNDLAAERAVLGALIAFSPYIPQILGTIDPADFFNPVHGTVYATIIATWVAADRVDQVTVADALRRAGVDDADKLVVDLIADTPGAAPVQYAAIVARHALARRVLGVAAELTSVYDPAVDPIEIAEHGKARLAELDLSGGPAKIPAGVMPVEEFINRPTAQQLPWAIPSLLRVGWRAIFVAAEGSGKSVILRQMTLCAAQGVHPFSFSDIPPVTTLLIDTENPAEVIDHQVSLIDPSLHRMRGAGYREKSAWIWHQPAGLNLRLRGDRGHLEAVVAHVRPKLVAAGPVYKLYRSTKNDEETAAMEVMALWDDLRTRYGFALVLEQHAPKKIAGSARELAPYGSQRWLAWPEFGIKLIPTDAGGLDLGRFRGDRIPASWPKKLNRGKSWPWLGSYEELS